MANLSNLLTGQSNLVTDQDLAAVATTGSYSDLTNKPTIFSGSYNDLTNKPTGGGGIQYSRKIANYTAIDKDGIIADTGSGSFTITLPASPVVGAQVVIVDGNNWGTNPLIVDRNGSTIESLSENLNLNIRGVSVQFIYDSTTWEIYTQAGTLGGTTVPASSVTGLATVATSGSYADLSGKPTLFSGVYTDLTSKPTLFSGSYTDLTNKPTLGDVLPGQTGNSGKYLSTDGTTTSWAVVTPPTATAVSDTANTSTGSFRVPNGTTAQRPASPSSGMVRFNTTTQSLEGYLSSGWSTITSGATFLSSNLSLYYDFGNASSYSGSGSSVYDLSGNSNTGSIQGSPTYSASNGGILNFTAAGQYIATSFKMPVAPRSHGYWVKFNSLTGLSGGVALSGTQEGGAYTYLGIREGGEIYYYIGAGTGEYTPGFGITAGTWFHLFQTITANGTVNIYKNGVPGFTTTGVAVGNVATANFGVGALGGGSYPFGTPGASIGKVTVYNIALTTQQVLDNFNADKSRYGY